MLTKHNSMMFTVSAISLALSVPVAAQEVSGDAQVATPVDNAVNPVPEAQASSRQATVADGEIIVTAQKRDQRLLDVPLSITAASGQQLASAGITSTADLGKIAPGFTFQESQYGTPVFGIRGISFFDFSSASSPAVSVYVVNLRVTRGGHSHQRRFA